MTSHPLHPLAAAYLAGRAWADEVAYQLDGYPTGEFCRYTFAGRPDIQDEELLCVAGAAAEERWRELVARPRPRWW